MHFPCRGCLLVLVISQVWLLHVVTWLSQKLYCLHADVTLAWRMPEGSEFDRWWWVDNTSIRCPKMSTAWSEQHKMARYQVARMPLYTSVLNLTPWSTRLPPNFSHFGPRLFTAPGTFAAGWNVAKAMARRFLPMHSCEKGRRTYAGNRSEKTSSKCSDSQIFSQKIVFSTHFHSEQVFYPYFSLKNGPSRPKLVPDGCRVWHGAHLEACWSKSLLRVPHFVGQIWYFAIGGRRVCFR